MFFGTGNGQFNTPYDMNISIDGSGNVWVSDPGNNRIEEFSSAGTYESQIGSPINFSGAGNIAFDTSGNIWTTLSSIPSVAKISTSAGNTITGFGSYGTSTGQFESPSDVAIAGNGNAWIVDTNNNRVQELTASGAYVTKFGSYGTANGQFKDANGIAIDGSGNLWVTDILNNRVQEFSATGTYVSKFGSQGHTNGKFSQPEGIAIDGSGNIWVVDNGNNRVQELTATGTYKTQIGCSSGQCSGGSGTGQFFSPQDIAIDGSGNIWVTDQTNNRVQEFSATGTYESQIDLPSNFIPAGVGTH